MSKKLITSILLPALILLGCPFNDASSYYPMNTIYLKRQGTSETPIVSSENERFSTFYSKLETPSIAVSKQGKFVIAWTDSKSGTRDIYARRFGITGQPEGEIFQVNTTSAGDQILPSVAINDNNEFIITWSTKGSEGNGYEVFARRYNASGNYIGNEFKVNTSVLREQWISSVGMNERGSFVIVWQSNAGGEDYSIVGQKFDAQGVNVGTEFLVSSTIKGAKEVPKIAMNASGEFVVAWKSNQNYYNSFDPKSKKYSDILVKSFDSRGMAKGEEAIVSTNIGENNLPSVAINTAGNFTVVWNAKENNAESYDIYARAFLKNTTTSNQTIKVTSLINRPDALSRPAVAMDSNNSSIVIWNSEEANKLLNGVFLKKYKSNGQEEFPETKISSASVSLQPDIVMDKSGTNYYVVWRQY